MYFRIPGRKRNTGRYNVWNNHSINKSLLVSNHRWVSTDKTDEFGREFDVYVQRSQNGKLEKLG